MKLEVSWQIFEKKVQLWSSIKIRAVGVEVLPCWQTDWHGEVNGRFSQSCEKRLKLNVKDIEYDEVEYFRMAQESVCGGLLWLR